MGFWNDGIEDNSRHSRRRSRSRSRSNSPKRHSSSHNGGGVYSRPQNARSASSFIESLTGYSQASRPAPRRTPSNYSSSKGFFGISSNNKYNYGSNSRARPRDGLVAKMRRWIRDLIHYMKKHPMKVFFLVIMPLITGGALTKILATVGVKLPPGVERMLGAQMGGQQGERYYARGGARDFGGGTNLQGMDGGIGGMAESAAGLMKVAKMFM